MINGDLGDPPMVGVLYYPFNNNQKLYIDDFRAQATNTVTHPYVNSTTAGYGSSPHNLLSGSAFDDDKCGGMKAKWTMSSRNHVRTRSSWL